MSAAEERAFAALLTARKVRRRQFVVEEGEVCRFETYVVKGCLRSFHLDRDGVEHIIQFASEDWWISDMSSFLRRAPARLTIEALEDSEILQVGREEYDRLLDTLPLFERHFRVLLQNAFIAHEQRILEILAQTAEERYAAFRARYPDLERRIPQKHIAAYIGVTPEFLSRLRSGHLRSREKR